MLKNIIFDLGVVILDIDFQRTMNEFQKLGIENVKEIFSGYEQIDFFDKFEKGQISPEEFRAEIKKHSKLDISDEMIDKAWNAMIIEFPTERINFIISLRKKYRIFVLSNTNAIHHPVYNKMICEQFGLSKFSDLFEKAYLSHEVGMRKPDQEIFDLVLNENELIPKETLFIDDSIQHIETAKKLGIQTVWLQPPETIISVINGIV